MKTIQIVEVVQKNLAFVVALLGDAEATKIWSLFQAAESSDLGRHNENSEAWLVDEAAAKAVDADWARLLEMAAAPGQDTLRIRSGWCGLAAASPDEESLAIYENDPNCPPQYEDLIWWIGDQPSYQIEATGADWCAWDAGANGFRHGIVAEAVGAMPLLNKVMSTSEATKHYGLAPATALAACRAGRLPARQTGKTWIFLREDADKLWGHWL